jgi:hypothetical protein
MQTFNLVSELTDVTLSSHFPNVGPLVLRFFPRQYPLWAWKGYEGTVRQSSAMAAVSTSLSREGEGVERQSAAGADETVTEVLGIWGLAGGRLKRRASLHRSQDLMWGCLPIRCLQAGARTRTSRSRRVILRRKQA